MTSGRPPCATGDPTTRCRCPSLRCNFRAAIAAERLRWKSWPSWLASRVARTVIFGRQGTEVMHRDADGR